MLQSVPIPGPHGVRPSLLVHSLLMLRTLERREATYEISVSQQECRLTCGDCAGANPLTTTNRYHHH